jgi:hypothetical protein
LSNVTGVEVSSGNLAVTVTYPDGTQLQLLPTLRTASGFRIASSKNPEQWSNVVRPASFARKLTEVNQANSGKLVPIIKLFKRLIEKGERCDKLRQAPDHEPNHGEINHRFSGFW